MMIDQQGKKTVPQSTIQKAKKRRVVSQNSVKFIVPMPGRASWMLKPNEMSMDNIDDHEFDNSFNTDNSADHSHLILSRKYYID
jgi:hypothetical protein